MKSTHLALAAGLLLGIYGGASKYAAAASLNHTISGANAASIIQLSEIADSHDGANIGNIYYENAIGPNILANSIKQIDIADSKISNTSLIAIRTIINADINTNQIDARLLEITA